MGKYFPKLTQTEVFIQTDEHGGGFNCPMLPVSAVVEMEKISDRLGKVETVQEWAELRNKMIALARTVMPDAYKENLERLDVPQLVELITYLMYGDPAGDDKAPKSEKNV